MKIKKSQLQKLVNEAVLREAKSGYGDEADKIIRMILKDEEWRNEFHNEQSTVERIAEEAVKMYIRGETFRLEQGLLHSADILEYIEQSVLDEWE